MDHLIPIMGYAKTYAELCTKIAEPGEFYNCLEEKPFMTYCKADSTEVGDTTQETDILGWFQVKAELESNIRPSEGDVYITGLSAPYTRWKAQYVNYVMTWVEDGTEEKKIVKKYANTKVLNRAVKEPVEGEYYAVGTAAPYKVYGVVSAWEPVGTFVSYATDSFDWLYHKHQKSQPGEIAFVKGLFYLFTGSKRDDMKNNEGWVQIDIPEPVENVYNHVFEKDGENYKLREGQYPGTLEFYQPR